MPVVRLVTCNWQPVDSKGGGFSSLDFFDHSRLQVAWIGTT